MSQYNETITEAYAKMVNDRLNPTDVITEEVITETNGQKVYHYNEDLAEAYVQMRNKQAEKIEEATHSCEHCGK